MGTAAKASITPSEMDKIIQKVVRGLAKETFRILYKSLTDGLPPNDAAGARAWHSDYVNELLPYEQEMKVAELALRIEDLALSGMFMAWMEPAVQNALLRMALKKHNRKNAAARKTKRSELFAERLRAAPLTSSKQIMRELEQEGLLQDLGDSYKIVATGAISKKTSITSKLSRMRTKLRNT